MIKSKETEGKYVPRKKTLTISDVQIDEDGNLYDEDGAIGNRIKELLPENVDTFSFKITFELMDE